jgi:hypothetical protein
MSYSVYPSSSSISCTIFRSAWAKALPIADKESSSDVSLSCGMPSKVCEGVCIKNMLELLNNEIYINDDTDKVVGKIKER